MSKTRLRGAPRRDRNIECTQPGAKKRLNFLTGGFELLYQVPLANSGRSAFSIRALKQKLDLSSTGLDHSEIGNGYCATKLRDSVA